ncbi:hypothetical protein [uncultured Corynebacterium sp.]|uniref:hypothetical protein n=1 Tax=uncultured Corynebacterium sp. TaxID=159447 RepID=UPI0025D59BC0|nr:hypothetical protein [uncultured Corynebacterium sp.]
MSTVNAPAVPTIVSVIGPHREEVAAVAAALQERVPGRRFVIGAGPDTAGGVIAVVAGTPRGEERVGETGVPGEPGESGEPGEDGTDGGDGGRDGGDGGGDAAIVRAVRDAMGGCILYTGGAPTPEPGVTVVRWGRASTDRVSLDRLVDVVVDHWIDVPRWVSDARRADVDRVDRVRVAVRLTAERHAADLLEHPGGVVAGDAATAAGRSRLDALFRARLRCTVLEHGVEWPHLSTGPTSGGASAATAPSPVLPLPLSSGGDRQRELLVLMASCGAGLAAAVAAGRLAGPVVGVLVGLVVAVTLALVRRRMLTGARRERDRAAGAAHLRRRWGAVATEVVSRLRVPTVADAIVVETTGVAR